MKRIQILSYLGTGILIYLLIGITYIIFINVYFAVTNRHTGFNLFEMGWITEVFIIITIYPLLLINFIGDEIERKKRYKS